MRRISLSISLIFSLLFSGSVMSQMPILDSSFMRIIDSDVMLPRLIDSAIKYSPVVKRMVNTMTYADENLVINKKNIYSSLSLNSSYNYGTNYSAINNTSGTNINNFTSSQSGFYNLGIGLQLPLTQIVSRKNIIKAAEAQVKIAGADKENAIQYVRQEVIRLYQEFKLDYKLLVVSGKNKESAKVNYSMAEREFNQGQSSLDQETRVMDIYNKSVIEYETYLNRFQTAYLQLETYTGTSISQIIKQVK